MLYTASGLNIVSRLQVTSCDVNYSFFFFFFGDSESCMCSIGQSDKTVGLDI